MFSPYSFLSLSLSLFFFFLKKKLFRVNVNMPDEIRVTPNKVTDVAHWLLRRFSSAEEVDVGC